MIAANYTMHLYCDCGDCSSHSWRNPETGEYVGKSWTECATEARKDGWRISADKTRATAPGHKLSRGDAA